MDAFLGALRGLLLEAAERRELALGVEHALDGDRAERADQFVLEVRLAGEKAVIRGARGRVPFADAGTFERTAHVPQLGDVAQPRELEAEAVRTERPHEALDVRRPADRHDDDAFGREVAAAPPRERFDRGLIAPPFDEDRCARIGGAGERSRALRVERRARARRSRRRCCGRVHLRMMA